MHRVTWCGGERGNGDDNGDDNGANDDNGDAHLLSRVSGKVEYEDGEEGDANTGDDQVHLDSYHQFFFK